MTEEGSTTVPSSSGSPVDPARDLGTPTGQDGIVVGAGRRGVTIRGTWAADGKPVAIKVGHERLDAERARRRFATGASAWTGLGHTAHLVEVLEAGVGPSGQPWLITPWSARGSLADHAAGGPLDVGEAALAARHAAAGLVELRAAGMVHGNLTPGNLIVGADGTVAVDGVSLPHLEPSWDPVPGLRGAPGPAPAHVPPEVIEGGAWTEQGDVWAWASVIHSLLHGRPPWATAAGRGPSAFLLAMATGQAPGLQRGDVPGAFQQLILAALSLEPEDRPEGAAALVAALSEQRSLRATTLAPPPRPAEPVGKPLGSSYLLQRPLGAGASGQVWLAERRWDHTSVAVKVLKTELATDPEQVARFLRERTTLVGLIHPHLVPVLDLVAEGETLAIVMGLVDGPDLRRLLSERPTMAPSDLCWLLAQVSSGVEAMHRAGIVHRDIKPENVLVDMAPDGQGLARLTDFGLARALGGPALTRNTQLVGTVEYLAPELVAGRPLSPAVDIYSLGVMAYEMACGWRPFSGDHPAAILRAHLDGIPARPPGMADSLWEIIARCLAKDPRRRPDAAALGQELVAVAPTLSGRPAADPAAWRPPGPDQVEVIADTDAGRSPREGGAVPAAAMAVAPPIPRPPTPPPPYSGPLPGAAGAEPPGPTDLALPPLRRDQKGPPGVEAVAEHRSPWRLRALVGAVVLVLGAGGGVTWALTHRTKPGIAFPVDVTTSVTLAGPGAVTVAYAQTAGATYLIIRRTKLGGPPVSYPSMASSGPASSFQLTDQAPGMACYEVEALLSHKPSTPTHGLDPAKECVKIT